MHTYFPVKPVNCLINGRQLLPCFLCLPACVLYDRIAKGRTIRKLMGGGGGGGRSTKKTNSRKGKLNEKKKSYKKKKFIQGI